MLTQTSAQPLPVVRVQEDKLLTKLINLYGTRNWSIIAAGVKGRSGKSCRLRCDWVPAGASSPRRASLHGLHGPHLGLHCSHAPETRMPSKGAEGPHSRPSGCMQNADGMRGVHKRREGAQKRSWSQAGSMACTMGMERQDREGEGDGHSVGK